MNVMCPMLIGEFSIGPVVYTILDRIFISGNMIYRNVNLFLVPFVPLTISTQSSCQILLIKGYP